MTSTAYEISRRLRIGRALLAMLLALLAVGCATPARKKETTVFFPPPPELPRLQYLTSYSGLKDVEEQSGFDKFVVGEKQDLKLDKPYGVAIWDGKIYVCDTNATVVVFDLKAKKFSLLKGAMGGEGKLAQPVNIAIERDGTKYVADPGRNQVVVYDKNDDYVKAYGIATPWRPVDAVPYEDRLYVVDGANAQIKVFDRQSGEVVKTIGDRGEPDQRLSRPTNVTFDREGYLYVSDIGRFQVVQYDRDGHYRKAYGKPGDNLGHFARPKGVALDRDGHVFVADASFNNVQIFSPDGQLLLFFGQGGEKPGDLLLPAQVAIDYDNLQYFRSYLEPDFEPSYLVLVTSQFGPRLVNVFAYGREKGKRYPTDAELLKMIEERRLKELEKLKKEPPKPPEAKPSAPPPEAKPSPPPGAS